MRSLKKAIDASGSVLAAGIALASWAAEAAAQTTDRTSGPVDSAIIALPAVMVTGSNIPTVDRETAVPVQIITREDIERANFQTAAQLANTISANVSYGTITENQAFAGSSAPGLASAGLRGLNAQRTLVLINGRRIANYAFAGTVTDFNMIPVAAIDRVEILKDGASAIYGSDAIGGVINFILRDEFRGLQATAQYSSPEQTGGWSNHFNVTGGYGSLSQQKFNVYGMIDYQQFGALAARDRDFSRSYYIPGAFNATSAVGFPANVRIGNDIRNPTGDPANSYRNPSCAPPVSFPTLTPPLPEPNRCNFDSAYFLNSVNASERLAAAGAFTWQVAPDQQFYVQGLFARNSFKFVASPTSLQNLFFLPSNSPWYPHAFAASFGITGTPLNTLWRPVELGGRTDEPILEQWNAVAGLKGNFGGWRYDTAFSYGVNSIEDRYTAGYLLATQIVPLLNSGRVNPFGYNTPDVVAELAATQVNGTVRTGRSTLLALDARAWNAVYELPAGPLSVAVGAEARQWRLTQTSSDALAAGRIVGVADMQSMSASRDVWAAFAETNVPLMRDFEANVALRFDHYSDVGSTTNPKVSLRWQPARTLLFRAAAGSGFRAPGLDALYAPQTLTNTVALNDPARCPVTRLPTDCLATFRLQGGGNPELQSEDSSQWGVGAVWSPTPTLSFSADYFDVIVHDLILGLNGRAIFDGCPDGVTGSTCRFIVRGPPTPAYPDLPGPVLLLKGSLFNLGTVRTNGIDLTAQYQFPLSEWGQFKLSAQGTYIIRYTQEQTNGSNVNQVNRELITGTGGAIPYWHHYLTLDWNYGPWAATLTENFQQGTYDAFPNPGESQLRKVGNYDVWNFSGSYAGFTGWQLSAGIKNLFDRDPPFTNQTFTASSGGPAGYDPTYANPIGRMFWGAIRYSFR